MRAGGLDFVMSLLVCWTLSQLTRIVSATRGNAGAFKQLVLQNYMSQTLAPLSLPSRPFWRIATGSIVHECKLQKAMHFVAFAARELHALSKLRQKCGNAGAFKQLVLQNYMSQTLAPLSLPSRPFWRIATGSIVHECKLQKAMHFVAFAARELHALSKLRQK